MMELKMKFYANAFKRIILILLLSVTLVLPCSPGPRYGYRQSYYQRGSPLVLGQFVPPVTEGTLGASGPSRKPITSDSPEFSNLEPNYNPDIIFMDEENDGSDRMMTRRCKDRVNTLAILVEDVWPGVRLRVTEAWESEALHREGSLHYEGRAVDITTSDRDVTKYGMLARLAVEAGFDWVYYKSKFFIHASVRADDSDDAKYGGCFPGDSLVVTKNNQSIHMTDLSVGDEVLSVDRVTGQLVYSDVIMMIDRDVNVTSHFVEIATNSTKLTLTKNHMLFVADAEKFNVHTMSQQTILIKWPEIVRPVHAEDVAVGQYIFIESLTLDDSKLLPLPSLVTSVRQVVRRGVVAPLTSQGTIVVDSTVASCYSVFSNEELAHLSFFPARTFEFFRDRSSDANGIHWYAKTLTKIAETFFPKSFFRLA